MEVRQTARAFLLNTEGKILLMKIEDNTVRDLDAKKQKPPFWVTIGGRIEEGESPSSAVIREVQEETGFKKNHFEVLKKVGYGECVLNWKNVPTKMEEHFFLVKVIKESQEITANQLEDEERSVFRGHKWWSIQELESSNEVFIPIQLIALVKEFNIGKIPETPLEIDLTTPATLM
ncbi:MAG: NUDIX domain-containing protein [Oligoflexia bacterium]|nr:NUDIX domain-containing protein [Oligoflexia bacterium]MBF0367295.1 NUDIX domain-containing protein [Oligoflexia bacterium]